METYVFDEVMGEEEQVDRAYGSGYLAGSIIFLTFLIFGR